MDIQRFGFVLEVGSGGGLSSFSKLRGEEQVPKTTTTTDKMTCRGANRYGNRCGTRYNLNEEGYCVWHDPNAVKCRGIAKYSGQRCNIVEGLNARGFCKYHKNQATSFVDVPYAHQCPATASSTGVRCRKDWEICPNGYCKYHQAQAPHFKAPQSQATREYVQRVYTGWTAQQERRMNRRRCS